MRPVSQNSRRRCNEVLILQGIINLVKIPFINFLKDCKATGFTDDNIDEEIIRIIWQKIKEPTKKYTAYELHSPWPFYLEKNKEIYLPTGFGTSADEGFLYENIHSKDFLCEPSVTCDKHVIIKLTAKQNICIDEGDVIARIEFSL